MTVLWFRKRRYRSLVVVLLGYLLFGGSLPWAIQEEGATASDLRTEGIGLYLAGDYVKAITAFERILAKTQERMLLLEAHLYISMCHYNLEDYEKAIEWLYLSLEIVPDPDLGAYIFPAGYDAFFEKAVEERPVKPDVEVREPEKPEDVKPDPEKPVVKTAPSVAPKAKKGGFPWLIGALAAGGGVAVAVLAGGKKGDSGPPSPQFGAIQVNSNPTGARIFLNGSDTGKSTNSALTDISPGTYAIKLVREGYVDVEGQVAVTAGQTATFSRDLAKHTLSVMAPDSGAVWVPGVEVEIRWTTGGGAAVHAAVPAGSPLAGGGVLDGGLAAQRAAVRDQALMGRAGVRDGMLYGGLADDRVDAGKTAALRGRADGRTDFPTGQAHQNMRSVRAAGASTSDHGAGRFVPESAAAEFAGALISGKPAVQDDSRVLVLSNVGIKLFRGSDEVLTIVARTNNTGSYKWTVSSDLEDAPNYKMRVYCADAYEVFGESREFRIQRQLYEIEMIYIPPGEFMMGSDAGEYYEWPVHRVRITKGFWLGKYEVTQGQWRDVMGSNPSYFKEGDNYPVEQVSWNDVQSFIQRLNQLTGRAFRIPTEAEWEYACRAGTTGERYGNLDDIAWYNENSGSSTQTVGRKQPNAFGLYDMLGNVKEWVQDWYDSTYYSRSPVDDPPGPSSGDYRVWRGGSWRTDARYVRAAYRGFYPPSEAHNFLGFRLARTD